MQRELLSDITAEPVVLKTISIPPAIKYDPPQGILDGILQLIGVKKRTLAGPELLKLEIRPATMSTAFRCNTIILGMRKDSDEVGPDKIYDIMAANTYDLAVLVATAVHNKPEPVPESLPRIIFDNFTHEELYVTVLEVYRGLDTSSFFATMELLKGLKIINDIPETTAYPHSSET